MTDEQRKRIWELIDEFRQQRQVAFFLTLEAIVTGENLVVPEFISTESPEGIRDLLILLGDRMKACPLSIMKVDRPE